MQIKDSVFIVTGGASGLGAGAVRLLAAQGGKVVIADLNQAAGEALASELGAQGAAARFVATNVADEASAQACVAATLEAFGAVHGLVGCAGIVIGEKTVGKEGAHALASFKRVIDINLVGAFNMIRLAAEAMGRNAPNAEGERGVIVSTASVAAYDGQIGQAAYAASKAGVVGMTLPIARDLMGEGIRINTILPGIFDTPLLHAAPENVKLALAASVPFPKRLGRPEEFAHLAVEMCRNGYFNGEHVRLDGAIRMAPR